MTDLKSVSIALTGGGHLAFDARRGPWTYRDFVCFVKADAVADEQVTYVPLDNIESIEVG
jgi:hypothetical protein